MIAEHLLPHNFDIKPSGPLDPLFLYADNVQLRDIPASRPMSEASRTSLVKASKSPTEQEILDSAYNKAMFFHRSMLVANCEPSLERAEIKEYESRRTMTPHDATGCQTVVEFREWQEAWRIRTEVECTTGIAPPEQSGTRESLMLTNRGATKIAESCEYVHLKHGGFKTFVTGTFREEVREQIANGLTTVQKEVSRTMDALQKMFQRGWSRENGERVSGHAEGLRYLWVVEVPENGEGKPNPHIHLLMSWQVPFQHFKEWSARIEKIWGNGYFHLEKIRDANSAGAYMMKAAGYLCKAQGKEDQGFVCGNRYGISQPARAPSWVVISRAQLHAMGQLIHDVYDHLTVQYGAKYRERRRLNDQLAKIPKKNRYARIKLSDRLQKVRKIINDIPIRCNKYQVVVKGKAAAMTFFSWLKTPSSETNHPTSLPEKLPGWEWQEGHRPKAEKTQYFTELYKRLSRRRFWRRLKPPSWVALSNAQWHASKKEYEQEQDYEPNLYAPTFENLQAYGFA